MDVQRNKILTRIRIMSCEKVQYIRLIRMCWIVSFILCGVLLIPNTIKAQNENYSLDNSSNLKFTADLWSDASINGNYKEFWISLNSKKYTNISNCILQSGIKSWHIVVKYFTVKI